MMIVCDIQISKKEGNRKIGIKNNVNFLWFYRLTKIFLWFYVNYCNMKEVEKVILLLKLRQPKLRKNSVSQSYPMCSHVLRS